jgi:hypothetical protein
MVSQQSKPRYSTLYRILNRAVETVGSVMQARDRIMALASSQVRQAIVHPLKPFPLAHVAGGVVGGASSQAITPQETRMMREHRHPLGIAGLPSATLQNAHAFLTLLPSWLPMPETRRHGHSQVALEWEGDGPCRFNVLIGQDGMMIYSARLGAKGRLDGAEPIGDHLSPIVTHLIRQLRT